MTDVDALEVAAWRMAVGSLASEDLPGIATEALVRGLDSPALRILAGKSRDDVRDSADLFRLALDELGIEFPDSDSGQWRHVRRIAGDIVAGRTGPASGATEMWLAYQKVRDTGDLRIFVGLTAMLDDHPGDAGRIEADVVAAARDLLARPALRRWIKLMAVPGRSPLAQTVGLDEVAVAPEALQLSDRLRADLARWVASFDATLSGWPARGGFASEREAEVFVAAGLHLVSQLQHELGPGYHVEYVPEPTRPPGVKLRTRSGF